MTGTTLLLLAAAVAWFNAGLHWYTQVATYPLFAHLPAEHFVAYHGAYERRLPLSIYGPYGLALLTTALLFAARPAALPVGGVWLTLALHLSVTAISVGLAVPLHRRLGREGKQDALIRGLVRVNALRLAAALLAGGVLVGALAAELRA